jgi:hypothetical protein
MIRINLSFTEKQYKAIKRNAAALEIKAGTWCKLSCLSSAGVQYMPDQVIVPGIVKQLDLFETKEKSKK